MQEEHYDPEPIFTDDLDFYAATTFDSSSLTPDTPASSTAPAHFGRSETQAHRAGSGWTHMVYRTRTDRLSRDPVDNIQRQARMGRFDDRIRYAARERFKDARYQYDQKIVSRCFNPFFRHFTIDGLIQMLHESMDSKTREVLGREDITFQDFFGIPHVAKADLDNWIGYIDLVRVLMPDGTYQDFLYTGSGATQLKDGQSRACSYAYWKEHSEKCPPNMRCGLHADTVFQPNAQMNHRFAIAMDRKKWPANWIRVAEGIIPDSYHSLDLDRTEPVYHRGMFFWNDDIRQSAIEACPPEFLNVDWIPLNIAHPLTQPHVVRGSCGMGSPCYNRNQETYCNNNRVSICYVRNEIVLMCGRCATSYVSMRHFHRDSCYRLLAM